ncbi:MAG: hypothetical protein JW726_09885 [Anaerolineales bacterium]|nr:hypothetical protein [Anaerolineales bacterium]
MMKFRKLFFVCQFLTLALLAPFLTNQQAVHAGGLIGPMFQIRDEPAPLELRDPDVAYNGHAEEYLVAFEVDRQACDDIRVERLAKDGTLLGGQWISTGCPAEQSNPDVAYNSQANEYLVVWEEYDTTHGDTVRGQIISAAGSLQGLVFNLLTCGTYSCLEPAVAYASTADKYLIVFREYLYIPNVITSNAIIAQAFNPDGSSWGTRLEISPASSNVSYGYPSLAYNHLRNEFLVVWSHTGSGQGDICGQRVKMAGGAGILGSPFWLPGDPNLLDDNPAVATIPRPPDGQYLVAWEYPSGSIGYDIRAQRVAGDGSLEGAPIVVFDSPYLDTSPAVAGFASSLEYLVVWETPVEMVPPKLNAIHGRGISALGDLLGEPIWSGDAAHHAAVASGPASGALIAFEDSAAENLDIWGQLWGDVQANYFFYLPLVSK